MAGSPSQDLALAVTETQKWIEAVTGLRFPTGCSLRAGLEDGILLCELMENLSPGSIRKINRSPSRLAHLDNIQQFLLSCKDLGLKDQQLFDMMDLQELPQAGNEKTVLDEKTKCVCITMFWLSQAVSEMQDYSGPQLNLSAFTSFITHSSSHPSVPAGEEGPLTFEEEQTADQLLADIQSAVDEMLHDFQTNTLSPESFTPPPTQPPLPPPHSPPIQPSLTSSPPSQPPLPPSSSSPSTQPPSTVSIDEQLPNTAHVAIEIQMNSGGRGFGFQVCGGSDTSMLAQVDMVLPGSSAEQGGLRSGDRITTVNGQNVMSLKHTEIVSTIRKAATEGHITMGILRAVEDTEEALKPDWREQQETQEQTSQVTDSHKSQAEVLKRMYPRSYHFLDSQLGSSLTPVMEEDLSPPLPPLPGESSSSPLPLLPRESSQSPLPPLPAQSPLPPLPGESSSSPVPSLPRDSPLSPLPRLPGESPSSPVANISPLPPLPGETSPSPVLPEVAALASVRGSVRELEHLQHSLDTHSSSTTSPVPEERIEPRLISEELQTIVQELGHEGGGEGGGEGDGRLEEQGNGQPWEPKTQWEDNMDERERGGEMERPGRKGKIWTFLEEKTRLSNEERELAVSSKPATSRKTPPPKVLPKPVRKKSVGGGQPSPNLPQSKPEDEVEGERGGQEEVDGGPDVPHVNGPIPSPDPNIITIQSTSSSEPLNIRPITEDEAELHGDIKIQKVGRTRWTPQKKSPEQLQRTMSTPPRGVLPRPPAAGQLPQEQQPQHYEESRPVKRYAGTPPTHQVGLPGAPPTHPGPIRQRSVPQYLVHSHQQRPQRTTPPHTPHHPQQQWGIRSQAQSRQLAEQTRISGTMPATFRGRVQSASTPTQANGGPSYDSLANAVREVKQLNTQQQNAKLRSQTWGARERNKFLGQPKQGGRPALALPEQKQDGLQQAFLVRPANPHLPCSLCRKPVGPQQLIAIPGLHLHYHPYCFVCPVCHTLLAPSAGHSATTVMVRSMRPHCHYCTSNPQGIQATEC